MTVIGTPVTPESSSLLSCSYLSLVNDVAFSVFGLSPTSTDVITDAVALGTQPAQILRAIRKGLQFVYNAHRWSFLRPKVSITTYPAYATDTITVDASGNVTLDVGVAPADGGFPSYAASAKGQLLIQTAVPPTFYGGSWLVASRSSATALALTDYTGPVFTDATAYTLSFNRYPMPTGYDSFEGEISFPSGWDHRRSTIERVDSVEIRRRLQHDSTPRRPEVYALFTDAFDPTVGSQRYFSFWPIPDMEYSLEVVGTWQPAMLDATNRYPLGGTLLAAVVTESCLAAAERDIKQMDQSHPDAVHSRAMMPLLALAIQRDKEYSAPDSLGIDHGAPRIAGGSVHRRQTGGTYWYSGGHVGWL